MKKIFRKGILICYGVDNSVKGVVKRLSGRLIYIKHLQVFYGEGHRPPTFGHSIAKTFAYSLVITLRFCIAKASRSSFHFHSFKFSLKTNSWTSLEEVFGTCIGKILEPPLGFSNHLVSLEDIIGVGVGKSFRNLNQKIFKSFGEKT